ncbi:MAG: hypothetical protein NTW28_03280 [Candidatus Solibacter sp.]|nr:hypothetical protein [Candidatus Solibacter sp.]
MITESQLNAFLGQNISQICQIGYADPNDNHCAHFVCHALGYQFGFTCRGMKVGTGTPANIRVQEVFPRCPVVGTWASRPNSVTACLVFITNASNVNVASKTMANVPRKHVGIFLGSNIWHYSNSQHKVVRQTPQEFSHHYASPDNAMFYGTLP